jgi:hypothetical protein
VIAENVCLCVSRYGDLIVALHPGTTSEERAALEDRFAREVNMMSRVKHENLVKVKCVIMINFWVM